MLFARVSDWVGRRLLLTSTALPRWELLVFRLLAAGRLFTLRRVLLVALALLC